MPRLRVLMLGWEFPPVINGGLGIACHGLGKAIGKFVDLTFVVPKVDPDFAVENVNLVGLDNLPLDEFALVKNARTLSSVADVIEIESDLSPYIDADPAVVLRNDPSPVREDSPPPGRRSVEAFRGANLYGDDVHHKVTEFARAAGVIASHNPYDVIHAHDWMTFPAGLEAKRTTGKPLVLHVHSLSYDRAGPDGRGWVHEVEKNAMEEADVVIPVSQYTGSIVTGHYGIDPSKVFPVHNGAENVETFRTRKPFPEKLVLFLGRLTFQKGPEYFLNIAAKVLEKKRDVRFVVAGTGDKLKQLIEHGAYKDVGDRLHFTGFLNKAKVNELLSMTDVYCMPSVSEPFGLSAIEAAQYGIPAVISKQSGVAEVLQRARKADFWDVDLMAEHILDLLEDPSAREDAIRASLEDQKNCTWERAAERIVDIYEQTIHEHEPVFA
ncbi:MAG: glycosyltransferase family 4 protein [Verrucomicrobiota bacterium]